MKRIILIGPVLFATVLFVLTFVKYDFLLGLGWHPIHAPTFDWPSGLALGDHGWIMTVTFLLSGFMMTLFASGLRLSLPPSRLAFTSTFALSLAGICLAGLAFTTDPTIRSTPATWHGRLHDLSFVLLGITLMTAMILLGFAFQADSLWRGVSNYTWLTVALAGPTFAWKGAAFYIFLLAILTWSEGIPIKLNLMNPN